MTFDITLAGETERTVFGLGILKPGNNKFTKEQVERFEAMTGKKFSDLDGSILKVKKTTRKEES